MSRGFYAWRHRRRIKASGLARKSLSTDSQEETKLLMEKVVKIIAKTPSIKIPAQAARKIEQVAKKEILAYATV